MSSAEIALAFFVYTITYLYCSWYNLGAKKTPAMAMTMDIYHISWRAPSKMLLPCKEGKKGLLKSLPTLGARCTLNGKDEQVVR